MAPNPKEQIYSIEYYPIIIYLLSPLFISPKCNTIELVVNFCSKSPKNVIFFNFRGALS
jgi:hypothetical protein